MSVSGPDADCEIERVLYWDELEERGEQYFSCVRNGDICNQRVNCGRLKSMTALFCISFYQKVWSSWFRILEGERSIED